MLTYKAGLLELHVLVNEESYTSKDGFLDADLLPIYDASRQGSPVFSGRRMKRR
jgi:putative transposase